MNFKVIYNDLLILNMIIKELPKRKIQITIMKEYPKLYYSKLLFTQSVNKQTCVDTVATINSLNIS